MICIESRLENWARVVKVYESQGVSMTGIACEQLRVNALKRNGPLPYDPDKNFRKQDPINHIDAWLVEKKMRNLSPLYRSLLVALYLNKTWWQKICNELSIRQREFDQIVLSATAAIDNLLKTR